MLYLSALSLGVLICLHVIGASCWFHKLFPKESPWWGFFLPALSVVILLNFIEHFVPLPTLFWLLPFSTGGFVWLMVSRDCPWAKLRLPSGLFVGTFFFVLSIKCMQPNVNFYCTEGLTDLNRILDFSLGEKVPPPDCWLPPYPHSGYYTFMHYGASVLQRLFNLNIGTAYNLGSVLLNSLVLLACAAVAHSLSNGRAWVAVLMLIVMLGGFTGSTPIQTLMHLSSPAPTKSIDITLDWDDPAKNDFAWLLHYVPPADAFRVYVPGCYAYYSEFHATIAGHFLALLTVFGVVEVLRRERTRFAWIFLLVVPVFTYLSCPWFVFIVGMLAGPTLVFAWTIGRRPDQSRTVIVGSVVTLALLTPTLCSFMHGSISQPIGWATYWRHDFWIIALQYWPTYVPWLALCFVWRNLDVTARWLLLWLIPIFLFTEFIFFGDRQTTTEKTMGGFYGVALVVVGPLLFMQKGWVYRGISGALVLSGLITCAAWTFTIHRDTDWGGGFMHLEGDYFIQRLPQWHAMEVALRPMHSQTILIGKNTDAWFESPCLPAFTNNRSFVGWTNAEDACGCGDEARARAAVNNRFYEGTMANPLHFLKINQIAAVLVCPVDKMSDEWLARTKAQLAPEFSYVDCKGNDPDNAGVFLRRK